MDQNFLKSLIDKYISGTASPVQQKAIDQWMERAAEKPLSAEGKDTEQLRDEMWAGIRTAVEPKQRRLRFSRTTTAIAAAISFGLIAIALWFSGTFNQEASKEIYTVSTGANETKKILLPDSSVVWLNGNSEISYPKFFAKNSRQIVMKYGEAFFKIKRNTESPFTVRNEHIDTKVLGTSFNIRSLKNKAEFTVIVKTGRVEVSPAGSHKSGASMAGTSFVLRPGDGILYHSNTGKTEKLQGISDADNWRSGGLSFVQSSVADVAEILQQHFHKPIRLALAADDDHRFTASFDQHTSLQEILNALTILTHLHYQETKNEVVITDHKMTNE